MRRQHWRCLQPLNASTPKVSIELGKLIVLKLTAFSNAFASIVLTELSRIETLIKFLHSENVLVIHCFENFKATLINPCITEHQERFGADLFNVQLLMKVSRN